MTITASNRGGISSSVQIGGALNTRLEAKLGGTILVIGDSTSDAVEEWPNLLASRFAGQYPTLRVEYAAWVDRETRYPATTVVQAGDGASGTLFIYNCSVGSKAAQYFMAPNYNAMIAAVQPDLAFINLGHNEGNAATAEPFWRDDLLALTEMVTQSCPRTELVLVTQNPRTDAGAANQLARRFITMNTALIRGLGLVDTYALFLKLDGSVRTELMIEEIHPNAAGEAAIATEIWSKLKPTRSLITRAQLMSTLTYPVANILVNGEFARFEAPPAVPSWTVRECTPSKDLVNFEGVNGWGVRLRSAAAAVSYIEQGITGNLVLPLRGQFVILCARVFIPEGENSNVGRIQLRTTGGAEPISQNSLAITQGQGGFKWVTSAGRIPNDAGTVTGRLYCENGTTNTGNCTYDRAIVARGIFPRDIR